MLFELFVPQLVEVRYSSYLEGSIYGTRPQRIKMKLITATIAAVAAAANLNAAGANAEVLHHHSRRSNEKEKSPGSQVRWDLGYPYPTYYNV